MNIAIPDFAPAIPEIFVMSMACVILMVDVFFGKRDSHIAFWLTQATLAVAVWLTFSGMTASSVHTFNNMYVQDAMSDVLKIMMYVILFVVFMYSRDYLRDRDMYRGEYFVLGLFGLVGMMVMASANNFLTVYMGLELLSLSLYALVAMQRDSARSTEAAMKYFVLGAIASGMLLYGMSMLYGVTGTLDITAVKASVATLGPDNLILVFGLVFVVVGLAFKLGAVPFHMWIPDVYDGAPTSVAMYVSSAPKLAAFAMVMRLLVGGLDGLADAWRDMFIILAILSMGLGNIIAIAQTSIKRMLAYSAISHMGFFMLGILSTSTTGYSSAMFYVMVYAIMSMGAFGMLAMLSGKGIEVENLEDFKGMNQRHPWYAAMMLIFMFSMAGVPPTFGFWAKLMVVQSVINAGMVWLAIVAVLFAVIGAYYYLRVIKLMYFDDMDESVTLGQPAGDVQGLLSINALALLVLLPAVGWFIEVCRQAITGIG